MYNNIGLNSVRGSGTSGYVQKNVAAVPKHRQNMSWEASVAREEKIAQRKPVVHVADREILDHERKKKVEIAVLEWAEAAGILDSEMDEEEKERLMSEKRAEIAAQFERLGSQKREQNFAPRSSHQERYEKDLQQERMAGALNIRSDYKEGQAFDREFQQREREERAQKREEVERLRREEARLTRQLEEKRRASGYDREERRYDDRRRRESPRRNESPEPRHRRRDSPSPPRRRDSPVRRRRDSPSPPRRSATEASPDYIPRSPVYAPPRSPEASPPRRRESDEMPEAPVAMEVDKPQNETSAPTAETIVNITTSIPETETKPIEEEEKKEEMATEEATELHEEVEEKAPKRGRGAAKRGSAAGKKATASATAQDEAEEPAEAAPKAKKGGRAKKTAKKAVATEDAESAQEEHVSDKEEALVEEEAAPKKAKRGRAKKAASADSDGEDVEAPPAKRAKRSGK